MKRLIAMAALATAATAGAQTLELGLTGGYYSGLSGEVFVHSPNVFGPAGIKLGVAYSNLSNPVRDDVDLTGGSGLDFTLNDIREIGGAGAVTESGSALVVSLDGTYGLGELSPGLDSTVYAGGRYGMFNGGYAYNNGTTTETTRYSSNSFGVGGGVMFSYALSGNLALVADLGVDTFFKSPITVASTGNDTFTTNTGAADYRYYDAAFNRPGTVFKARIGVKTSF